MAKTGEWQKKQAEKRVRRKTRQRNAPKRSMSDAARLFRAVYKQVNDYLPSTLPENRVTLAMLITGILRSRSGQLKKIVRAVQYDHKKESLVDRFRRFVRHDNIEVAVEYAPFNQQILGAVKQGPIVLLIDSTQMGGKCICLMVSVYDKNRALPWAWLTFKGRKGHSSQAKQLALLKRVQTLLPDDVSITLLGDGEFDGCEVVEWLQTEAGWQYVCRTDHSNLIFYQGQWIALNQLPLQPGEETFLSQVWFTQAHQVGPVNILVVWNEAKQAHWFFVTNVHSAAEAKAWYKLRFTTETLFADFKDRGFHLDDTRLWHPERVNRLVLAGAMAYFFTVVLGVASIISRDFIQLVRTDAFYHSLFQLGLIYLNHLLNACLSFPDLAALPPPDDFVHIVIS